MNMIIATQGSFGDVYPMIGLGDRLKRRGHRVALLTNPFFEELATKYGLDFIPVGTRSEYERFSADPELFDPRKSVSVFFKTLIVPGIRPSYERLRERLGDHPVIVSSITVFASRLVQEKFGVPVVTVHATPMALKSAREMPRNGMAPFPDWMPLCLKRFYWWVADKAVVDPLIGPELNAFRKELGLAPVERIMMRWGHSPRMVIGMFPPWWAAPQPDWPPETRLTGFPLFAPGEEEAMPPDVEAFLEAGDPPVVFMPASLMRQSERYYAAAVGACSELGKRAVLLSRDARHIPSNLPGTVRHFSYVPLGKLMPRAAVFVHQGGIGACAQAMRHGVPQLVSPMAYDQFDNAYRMKRLGIGETIDGKAWDARTVADGIQALLDSADVRERCRAVAEKFAGDPLIETCELIESVDSA